MVDPQLEIEPYVDAAAEQSMRITHVFETHVQADHLSGARRLAGVTRAPVFFHESAAVRFPHCDVADDEEHDMGSVRLTVLHTPGHTPDGVSILVADRSRAPEPWCVLTGDTLLPGGVGRPERLGHGAETRLAEQLYDSLHGKLLRLPDHLEVYPGHLRGAASGPAAAGPPGSTIGFERRFNPALQLSSRAEFVRFVLAGLGPEPEAFAETRRRNLGGD